MRTIIAGFIAGFVSVLVFHQLGFFISNELGLTKAQLYSHHPVAGAVWSKYWPDRRTITRPLDDSSVGAHPSRRDRIMLRRLARLNPCS